MAELKVQESDARSTERIVSLLSPQGKKVGDIDRELLKAVKRALQEVHELKERLGNPQLSKR
jgi:hypothetical protein